MDYLTLYDGPDAHSPVIARLCGNTFVNMPTYYSSGTQMTAVFTTQAGTPGSYGFKAGWVTVGKWYNFYRGLAGELWTCPLEAEAIVTLRQLHTHMLSFSDGDTFSY